MKGVCQQAQHSAAGLDHFSPEDFTYLSDETYHWIAEFLNAIEDGAAWPDDITQGRAAFLSKDTINTDNPLAYRVLLILPTIYRRWATARLKDLLPWIRLWQKTNMCAGVEGGGAEEGWYSTALLLEHYQLNNIKFAGSSADIFKCFDHISRPLMYHIAAVAGMPRNILFAYQRFQEQMRVYNALALGLGARIPGDPQKHAQRTNC